MNPNTSSTDRQVAASADTQITSSSAPDAQTAISPAQAAVPDTQTTHSPDAQATPPQSPAAPQAAPPKKHGALSAAFSDYLCALRDGKNLFLLWAFLIPAGLLLLFYISRAVFPIGEGSVLILDLNGQYVSFFEELRNKLLGGGSLLYSWSRTLGGEFLGIFAYYLASPFSLIVCLFPASLITEALLLMFMLKAGACGFTMALYLRTAYPGRKVVTVAFSTLYALSSYAVVQAHNTMWIDELIFLPLLVLGIERLIQEKKFLLYTVSLAYCALSNFYIGYMVCIFTFFYFFYYYFAKSGGENNPTGERCHLLRSLGRMLLFSTVALLIAAAVICPAYVSLAFGKNEFSTPDYTLTSKFDLFDLFARLFPASYDTVRPNGLPFIYCGVLTALTVPAFFASRKIGGREKVAAGGLICVFIFSFVMSSVDIVWHGLQKPNWLNYRYSFMLIFVLTVLAYRAFSELRDMDIRVIGCTAAAYILLLAVSQKLGYDWFDGILGVMLSVLLILVWLGVICAMRSRRAIWGSSVLLILAVCGELLFAGIYTEDRMNSDVSFTSRTSYRSFIDCVKPSANMIKEYNAEKYGKDDFYRTEKTVFRKTNDGMALGIYGISSSSSLLNRSVVSELGKLGIGSASNWTRYYGGNPVFDSLFSIRYLICENDSDAPLYDRVTSDSEHDLAGYENPYALPLCFGVNEDILGCKSDDENNPFARMNAMLTAMLGEDETVEVWKPLDATAESDRLTVSHTVATDTAPRHAKYTPTDENANARLTFTLSGAGEDRPIYAYFPSSYQRKASVYIDGERTGAYFDGESYSILPLGMHGTGEELTVALKPEDSAMYIQDDTDYFWYLDRTLFESVMTRLGRSGLDITHFSDTHIEGSVNAAQGDRVMFTSIPYDEGWRVYIDGERADLLETSDFLLAFELPEGQHTVELRYLPNCVIIGTALSAVGIASFAAICVVKYRKRRKDGDGGTNGANSNNARGGDKGNKGGIDSKDRIGDKGGKRNNSDKGKKRGRLFAM